MIVRVTFDVDEETLLEASETDDVESAIDMELGWLAQSGFSVSDIEIIEE